MPETLQLPNRNTPGPFYIVVYDENLNLIQANRSARSWHNLSKEDVMEGRYCYDDFAHLYKPSGECARKLILEAMNGTVSYYNGYDYGDVWFTEYGPADAHRGAYVMAANIGQTAKIMRTIRQKNEDIATFPI